MRDASPEPPTDTSNRRSHHQVEYPVHDRPAFVLSALTGAVSDCSETGVRVALADGHSVDASVEPGDRAEGSDAWVRP